MWAALKPGFGVMTRGLPLIAALLAVVGLTATAVSQQPIPVDPGALTPGIPHQVTVRLGDSVVVDGVPIGCAVARRGGRVVIECGRTGDVGGTYMTIVGRRTVKVARMRSDATAKVIFTATHGAGWRACGMPASAARAGGKGCH
jgi:hypothetical protein